MALELLRCSICPNTPYFSDTSHLLTHIGSKGHLSHLHKLQVRSHEDAAASHLLAMYNTWYHQHSLAELLSDRMRQKQLKQARHQVNIRRRKTRKVEDLVGPLEPSNAFLHLSNQLLDPSEQDPKQQRRTRRRVMQDEMDDPNYVPSLPLLCGDTFSIPLTYESHHSEGGCVDPSCQHIECVDSPQPSLQSPHEVTRLKGQIWPGMDVFDSATEEQARKRNQRKDLSVVMIMQANSMKIEPVELTFVHGAMVRKRHMDDLDNEDNLVEGESPVKKPAAKRQRKTRPHEAVAQTTKHVKMREVTPTLDQLVRELPASATSMHTTSALFTHYLAPFTSSPLNVAESKKRRTKSEDNKEFTVYQDVSVAATGSGLTPTSLFSSVPEYRFVRDIDMSLDRLPWLQAQTPRASLCDPFKDYPKNSSNAEPMVDIDQNKENVNTLTWKQEPKYEYHDGNNEDHLGSLYNMSPDFSGLSPIYAYTRNTLTDIPIYQDKSQSPVRDALQSC